MINEYFLIQYLKKNKKKLNENENIFLKLGAIRNFIITKDLVGLKISVYNGHYYIPIKITEDMINQKFGSFSFSFNIIIKKKKINMLKKKVNKNGAFS